MLVVLGKFNDQSILLTVIGSTYKMSMTHIYNSEIQKEL